MSWAPKLWNRGYARASIMGPEATMNPTPPAAFLLGMSVESPKFHRVGIARRSLLKGRRHPRTGNPVPAALIAGLAKFGPLKGLFKKRSEARAGEVAGALVASAVAGNLTAARAIQERTAFGIAKERAVWAQALARVPPTILKLVQKYKEQIPGVDHTTPESAAASAAANPVDGLELEAQAKEATRQTAAERRAAQVEARELGVERESRFLAAGTSIGQALLSRGRALPRRKTRRRRSPRAY